MTISGNAQPSIFIRNAFSHHVISHLQHLDVSNYDMSIHALQPLLMACPNLEYLAVCSEGYGIENKAILQHAVRDYDTCIIDHSMSKDLFDHSLHIATMTMMKIDHPTPIKCHFEDFILMTWMQPTFWIKDKLRIYIWNTIGQE